MRDNKTIVRNLLIGDSALIALVPAQRIKGSWPTSFATLPLIAFRESTNYVIDEDFFDDMPESETSIMQIDIFQNPGISTTPIAIELDRVLTDDLWTREYAEDLIEPDTLLVHKVMRYSKRF